MLSADLIRPKLEQHKRALPELEPIIELVRRDNPALKASQLRLDAASQRVNGARYGGWPKLEAEVVVGDNSRITGSSDRWRAGINVTIPLYEGGGTRSALLKAQAERYRQQTRHRQLQLDLEQQTLDSWMRLQDLKQQLIEANTNLDYRELYLDRSRANYELEFRSDLGDSMAQISDAQRKKAQAHFEIALEWERLAALTNGGIEQLVAAISKSKGTE